MLNTKQEIKILHILHHLINPLADSPLPKPKSTTVIHEVKKLIKIYTDNKLYLI